MYNGNDNDNIIDTGISINGKMVTEEEYQEFKSTKRFTGKIILVD